MEGVKTFFESLKEFIWDIIGYFIPGLYLIIILSICINPHYFFHSELMESDKKEISPLILLLSYVLGYVIYGYSELKERILKGYSYMKQKEEEIKKRTVYTEAKEIIQAKLLKTSNRTVTFTSVREVRNICMSSSPEADQKVYTFMFRSELSRHIGNVSFTIGLLGILNSLSKIWLPKLDLFASGTNFTVLYALLMVSYLFLRETRNRFYSIALTIPFSIYLSKQTADAKQA